MNNLGLAGWNDAFDDADGVLGEIAGQQTAAAALTMAAVGAFFDTARQLGGVALMFVPAGDAIQLMMTLAERKPVSMLDVIGAGLSVAGPLGKALGSLTRMLFKYASKGSGLKMARNGDELVESVAKGTPLNVLQKLCFVAGTLVLMADGAERPIDAISLLDSVASAPDPMASDGHSQTSRPRGCLSSDPADWRIVSLIMETGIVCRELELLRPIEWMDQVAAEPGSTIWVSMPEFGAAGWAKVVKLADCPANAKLPPDPGCVTGRYVTYGAPIVWLWIDSDNEPIGTTDVHPFWSLDRQDWIAAGNLFTGETLATCDGSTVVMGVSCDLSLRIVYNLEVASDNTFYVSRSKVWAHNSYTDTLNILAKDWLKRQTGARRFPPKRYSEIQQNGVTKLWDAVQAGRFSMNDLVNGKVPLRMNREGDLIANGINLGSILPHYP